MALNKADKTRMTLAVKKKMYVENSQTIAKTKDLKSIKEANAGLANLRSYIKSFYKHFSNKKVNLKMSWN